AREWHRGPLRRRWARECRWLHRPGHPRRGRADDPRRHPRGPPFRPPVRRSPRSGVLPVEKGAGVSSFQMVAHVRRLLRAAKLGHGGTLDPEATGVLPLLVGEATKLMPYLAELEKEYVATVTLGIVTDTQDASGRVLLTRPVPPLAAAALERVLERF